VLNLSEIKRNNASFVIFGQKKAMQSYNLKSEIKKVNKILVFINRKMTNYAFQKQLVL